MIRRGPLRSAILPLEFFSPMIVKTDQVGQPE
jgi:hypothetical protein